MLLSKLVAKSGIAGKAEGVYIGGEVQVQCSVRSL